MNPILLIVSAAAAAFAIGASVGVAVTMFERAVVQKLVADTLKDDSGAWDFVRMAGAAGVATYLAGWWVAMLHDPLVIVNHANDFGMGLVETLGAYAGSVVGHSWAKK